MENRSPLRVLNNSRMPPSLQVLALITHPPLLESADFPSDAKDRARTILAGCKGSFLLRLRTSISSLGLSDLPAIVVWPFGNRLCVWVSFLFIFYKTAKELKVLRICTLHSTVYKVVSH
jgi:hypothetical protein